MLKKYQNIIIITSALLVTFLATVIYELDRLELFLPFTILGSLLFLMMYLCNNIYRITKYTKLEHFVKNMYFYGMMSFVLLLAHEAKFSIAMKNLLEDPNYYPKFFLQISFYLFLLIIPMAITSIEKYRPKSWKIIQRIFMWSSLPLIILHLMQVDYYFWSLLFVTPFFVSIYGLIIDQKNYKIYTLQIISFFSALLIFGFLIYLMEVVMIFSLLTFIILITILRFSDKYSDFHKLYPKFLALGLSFLVIFSINILLF